jgi:hypothetical protein
MRRELMLFQQLLAPRSPFSWRSLISWADFVSLNFRGFAELPRKTGLACRELIEMTFFSTREVPGADGFGR